MLPIKPHACKSVLVNNQKRVLHLSLENAADTLSIDFIQRKTSLQYTT